MTGWLKVVGLGPGDAALQTPQATEALRQADVIVGYTLYVALRITSYNVCYTKLLRWDRKENLCQCRGIQRIDNRGEAFGAFGMAGTRDRAQHALCAIER